MLKNSYQNYWSQRITVSTLVSIVLLLMIGCNTAQSNALSYSPEPSKIKSTNGNLATQTARSADKLVSFKGVELYYDSDLIESIEVRDVQAYIPKEGPTYLPDAFEARHLNFQFKGASLRTVKQGDYPTEINIFSVEQFKQLSKRTARDFVGVTDRFRKLQQTLSDSQNGGDCPFIPWIGASQAINAHKKFISFKNGKGIGCLTQFNMDVDLINNDELLYVFQGITVDNKYFISATFPVRVSYLPDDRGAATYKNYARPEDFYAVERRDQNLREYKQYLLNVQAELENTDDRYFEPSLIAIQKMLSSMEVHPTVFVSDK